MHCPACGFESPSKAAFCAGCGTRLGAPDQRPRPDEPPATPATLFAGERRTVTVMLSDLSGFTAMNEIFDPEVVAEIMDIIKGDATRIIESFGGIVNQFIGDEVVGLFGLPNATGQEPRRATLAALELHAQVRRINERVGQRLVVPLRMHTGIQTGLLLAERRDQRSGIYELTGDTINTAARLLGLADRDEVVVGDVTHQLIEADFETEPIGEKVVRGKAEPIHGFRIGRQRHIDQRFDRSRRRLTPLTGRDEERRTLQDAFDNVRTGRGVVVGIAGEPGSGKSRLTHDFLTELQETDAADVLLGQCEAYGELVSYQPFVRILRSLFGIDDDDPADIVAERVVNATSHLGQEQSAAVAAVLHVLSAASPRFAIPTANRGDELPEFLQRSIVDVLTHRPTERPLVVCLEDWHWADNASTQTLARLAKSIDGQPMLLVVTHRLGTQLPQPIGGIESITLAPLTGDHTRDLIAHCLHAQSVQDELVEKIRERTLGNPFFVEEICASLVQSGGVIGDVKASFLGRIEDLDLPTTVQSVVLSRVDALTAELRDVLRIASVIGREFDFDLLASFLELGPATVSVGELARLGFVVPLVSADATEFRFTHVITQEVTYGTLLRRQRTQVHQRVAELIEARSSEKTDKDVEALARHYQQAGNAPKAVEYLSRAGRKAAANYELSDARHHLRAAIAVAQELRDPAMTRQRIGLTLTWAALAIFSPSSDQIDLLGAAQRDAEGLGETSLAARALYWQAFAHYAFGDIIAAERDTREVFLRADPVRDVELWSTTLQHLGLLMLRRDSVEAERALGEGTRLLEEASRARNVPIGARQKFAYAVLGACLIDRGFYERGNALLDDAIASVREKGQRSTEASNLITALIGLFFRSDWTESSKVAKQAIDIAEQLKLPYHLSIGGVLAAYARFRLAESDGELAVQRDAVNDMERNLRMQEDSKALLCSSISYACCADAASRLGDWERARQMAAASLERETVGDILGIDLAHRALLRVEAHTEPDAVPRRIERLMQLASEHDSVRERALAHLAAAEAFLVLGAAERVRSHADQAAAVLDVLGPQHLIDELRRTRAAATV